MSTASEVFAQISQAIEKACETESLLLVVEEAIRLGMDGGDNSRINLYYDYTFDDGAGGAVALSVSSYDPSGPFQNLPDINRFSATLAQDGTIRQRIDRAYGG